MGSLDRYITLRRRAANNLIVRSYPILKFKVPAMNRIYRYFIFIFESNIILRNSYLIISK